MFALNFSIVFLTGVPEDESVPTLHTAASVKNEAVDESSQEDIQQAEEIQVTYTKEVQTPQNELDVKKDIHEVLAYCNQLN